MSATFHNDLLLHWGRVSEATQEAYAEAARQLEQVASQARLDILESFREDTNG